MRDIWYDHLIQESQSTDLQHRLDAWRDLGKEEEYLDRISAQYLLDRLNSTESWQEQSEILGLMCRIKDPLPIDALMAILEDYETSDAFLRMDVARVLARVQAEEALDLFLRVLMDPDEHPWLREAMTSILPMWGEHVSSDLLLQLVVDQQPSVVTAALEELRDWPPDTIPLETVLSYCTHEQDYVREAALKTLLAASIRVPPEVILSALHDPESRVRAAASHGCMSLVEWFGDLPLEPLLSALHDEHPPVREDILDAFGKIPLRIPVEPVIAALSDPVHYVRCAAVETLGLMGERVPSSIYPILQEMSGSDTSAHVRQRATRTLLLLHGMQPAPLRFLTFDPTLEDLEE